MENGWSGVREKEKRRYSPRGVGPDRAGSCRSQHGLGFYSVRRGKALEDSEKRRDMDTLATL